MKELLLKFFVFFSHFNLTCSSVKRVTWIVCTSIHKLNQASLGQKNSMRFRYLRLNLPVHFFSECVWTAQWAISTTVTKKAYLSTVSTTLGRVLVSKHEGYALWSQHLCDGEPGAVLTGEPTCCQPLPVCDTVGFSHLNSLQRWRGVGGVRGGWEWKQRGGSQYRGPHLIRINSDLWTKTSTNLRCWPFVSESILNHAVYSIPIMYVNTGNCKLIAIWKNKNINWKIFIYHSSSIVAINLPCRQNVQTLI